VTQERAARRLWPGVGVAHAKETHVIKMHFQLLFCSGLPKSFFPGKGFVAGGDGGAVWVDILGKGAV